jgi:hypothetical protein
VAVRLATAAVLTLVAVAPVWAADDAVYGPTAPRLQPGAPPYHLAVGGLDGTLGRGDLGADDPTPRLVAQTSGAPATAGTTATAPDEPEESASALNQKLTNPVSTLWSLSNQFNNFKLENGHWNNNWNFRWCSRSGLERIYTWDLQ